MVNSKQNTAPFIYITQLKLLHTDQKHKLRKRKQNKRTTIIFVLWSLSGGHVSASVSTNHHHHHHHGHIIMLFSVLRHIVKTDTVAPPCGGKLWPIPAPNQCQSNMATRWGICSAGKISNDFTVALKTLPPGDHQVSVWVDASTCNAPHVLEGRKSERDVEGCSSRPAQGGVCRCQQFVTRLSSHSQN